MRGGERIDRIERSRAAGSKHEAPGRVPSGAEYSPGESTNRCHYEMDRTQALPWHR